MEIERSTSISQRSFAKHTESTRRTRPRIADLELAVHMPMLFRMDFAVIQLDPSSVFT